MSDVLTPFFTTMPLVAILRGVTVDEIEAVVECLVDAGISIIEVPLNSPAALDSIAVLSKKYGDSLLTGAGTVTTVEQVDAVAAAGGRIIVSPNADTGVIKASKAQGLVSCPGVATPTEAFAAIYAGADAVKAFPAEMITPTVLKSWCAVLPRHVPVLPVGGIDSSNMAAYWHAGASGFGLGGGLYKPGKSVADIHTSAQSAVDEIKRLRASV